MTDAELCMEIYKRLKKHSNAVTATSYAKCTAKALAKKVDYNGYSPEAFFLDGSSIRFSDCRVWLPKEKKQ